MSGRFYLYYENTLLTARAVTSNRQIEELASLNIFRFRCHFSAIFCVYGPDGNVDILDDYARVWQPTLESLY